MTWLKQAGVLLVGLGLAGVMVLLGVWQFEVYQRQGAEQAARRAAEPPVALDRVAPPGTVPADAFGRTVTFRGTYVTGLQQLLPVEGRVGTVRVLAAVRQADGGVVPVVRGLAPVAAVPAPPSGVMTQHGVFLPSEEASTGPDGRPASVRVPALAQDWPGPLVAGFVTLAASEARRQHLEPAPVALPEARGRLRNGAYAVQWWVFAAFAAGMALRMARDLGLRALAAEPSAVAEPAGRGPTA